MSTTTYTNLGTPCARSWSEDWIAAVNAKESELNQRICGARLPDATPCPTTSDHPTGRCKYHGGCDLIGAPKGNRNAAIHGIYSRRLRTCSQSCPHWQTCPIAQARSTTTSPSNLPSEALAKEGRSHSSHPSHTSHPSISSIPPTDPIQSSPNPKSKIENPKSPPALTCPYQLMEYNTVLTDALAIIESQPHPNPMGIHSAHNLALLQVLISNAATQLTNDTTEASTGASTGARASRPCSSDSSDPNPNATLAFIRLMREFRASMKMLYAPVNTPLFRQKNIAAPPTPESVLRHVQRMQHDTQLDPDSLAEAQLDPNLPQTHAKAYLQQAIHAASQGCDVEMCEAFDAAAQLDEPLAETERDHVLASYRPAKQSVSEELAAQILGNLHLPPLPATDDNDTAEIGCKKYPEDFRNPIQDFLDEFCEGKIPPEAFPLDTPIRAHAERIYTGPRNHFAETT